MKDDDVFKEIGQGMVIWVMLCLAPLFLFGNFYRQCIFYSRKGKVN